MLDNFLSKGSSSSPSFRSIQSRFPSPFEDYSSLCQPNNIKDVLDWAEFLWGKVGTWRMVAKRVVRYFITHIELDGKTTEKEEERYKDFLENTLHFLQVLAELGDSFMASGNSFSSINMPFRRFLICPKCIFQKPSDQLDYKFENLAFHLTCPKCGYRGEFLHSDRRSMDETKFKIIQWSPKDMRLLHHLFSGRTEYIWDIPKDFSQKIKDGSKFYLEDTPWSVIKAAYKDESFKFNDGFIYHMKEPVIAGIKNNGWGIPTILYNFAQVMRIQLLKRYDEAICMDYIVPFRVFSPGSAGGEDAMMGSNVGGFMDRTLEMINEHRQDPTSWHAIPYPIEYQAIGGEGQALTPVEMMNQSLDELLNESGFPSEMYKGTISVQSAPTALRLFQQTWIHLVGHFNSYLDWVLDKLAISLNWERVYGKLQHVTLADDLEKRQLQLQLAAGQIISKDTALAPLNIRYKEEMEKMMKEELYMSRKQEELQKEEQERQMQLAQISGEMDEMMGGGSGVGSTPMDVKGEADQMAQQIFQIPDSTTRRRMITQLKHSDPTMHALVTAKLDDLRQQAGSEGVAMAQSGQGAM
jgi:hypothetical protein